jgi:hypothetical protein
MGPLDFSTKQLEVEKLWDRSHDRPRWTTDTPAVLDDAGVAEPGWAGLLLLVLRAGDISLGLRRLEKPAATYNPIRRVADPPLHLNVRTPGVLKAALASEALWTTETERRA